MPTAVCPGEALRHKLALMGIPREAHERDRLARFLPVRIAPDDIDPDALAEALIYLIDKEIIRPPCGVGDLMDFHWGSHVCHLYRSREELLQFLAEYFAHGLESGEYCVWVAPDRESGRALHAALAARLPRFDARAGAIECVDYAQWYYDENGQLRPAEVVLARWMRKAEETMRAGFHGLRCAAGAPHVDRGNWSRIAAYECEANAALPALRIKAVCAYPLLECGAPHLNDVRASHDEILAKGEEPWHRVCAEDAVEASAVLMALKDEKP